MNEAAIQILLVMPPFAMFRRTSADGWPPGAVKLPFANSTSTESGRSIRPISLARASGTFVWIMT